MDRLCDTCGHTTDDGEGYCRFCRTPFKLTKAEKKEKAEAESAAQIATDLAS